MGEPFDWIRKEIELPPSHPPASPRFGMRPDLPYQRIFQRCLATRYCRNSLNGTVCALSLNSFGVSTSREALLLPTKPCFWEGSIVAHPNLRFWSLLLVPVLLAVGLTSGTSR